MRLWLGLVSLAACGRLNFESTDDAALPLIEEPPRYAPGSRLRPVVYRGANGAVFDHWFDTQLGVDCYVRAYNDGVFRCGLGYGTGTAFKDAGCTDEVIVLSGPPAIASCGLPPLGQESGVQAFVLGPEWLGSVYSGTPGNCMPYTTGGNEVHYFERGTDVPDTAFVRFDKMIVRGGQRLGYVQLVGEDGAVQRHGLYDTKLEAECEVWEGASGSGLCVPTASSSFVRYLDASCTELAFVGDATSSHGIDVDDQLCTPVITVYERGDAVAAGTRYDRNVITGQCSVATATTEQMFRPGAAIPLSTFEPLTLETEPYDTQLARNIWRTADGIAQPNWDKWLDIGRGMRCEATIAESTSGLVCAPAWGTNARAYWTTADCTGPALGGLARCRPDSNAIFYFTLMMPSYTCDGARFRVFMSDAPVDTLIYETDADGRCVGSTQAVYTGTRELLGTEMVPLTQVQE